MSILKDSLLMLGGSFIMVSGFFTLEHLTDRVVATVLVPGFVFGLILICIAMSLGRDRWRWFGQ